MSITQRQNRLLLAEDWKRIYQSFRNAEFQSYDFDNLRRVMIAYLRENYPEDFNDYIESSEYLALIDLIAFLGQNLSYRMDLNARENFLELADRRESVLRLARLLSYNATRNQCANGLLKVVAVSTSENVIDSNNLNLANAEISWSDSSNSDWYEQFIKVLNAAFGPNTKFGKPIASDTVNGITTKQYQVQSSSQDIPVYGFNKSVDGRNFEFEITSAEVSDGSIKEQAPLPGRKFSFVHRDDGQGASSANTGFFVHFRQGFLDQGEFNVSLPTPNQSVNIDARNINNTDVWLYQLDEFGIESKLWTKLDSVVGNNIIYNALNKNNRTTYSTTTRTSDRIALQFSDGVFGELPQGGFRVYYRTSDNLTYSIKPSELQNVQIDIPYVSASGKTETLSFVCSLQYTVDNGTASESSANIKVNAPTSFYTQNRMITGEDYNVAPLGKNREIVKVKSTNRVSTGISKYFDFVDATGTSSDINVYGNDGVVYRENINDLNTFTFSTRTDIEGVIINKIEPVLSETRLFNYFINQFPDVLVDDLNASFVQSTKGNNISTGLLQDPDSLKYDAGPTTTSQLKYVETGALCKFEAPTGFHFMADGTLMAGSADHPGSREYIWTSVVSVVGDGKTVQADGTGPIAFSDVVPTGAILKKIKSKFTKFLSNGLKNDIIDQIFAFNTFGLRFDTDTRTWKLIKETNLNVYGDFNIGKSGDDSNQRLDSSWLLLFTNNGETYTMENRGMRYVFESDKEIRFFYDSSNQNYNPKTGKTKKDQITVLSINTKPNSTVTLTSDVSFSGVKEYRENSGYVNSKKLEVALYDSDQDGFIDNPESFELIVDTSKFIFQKIIDFNDGSNEINYVDATSEKIVTVQNANSVAPFSTYDDGTILYLIDSDSFKSIDKVNNVLVNNTSYLAKTGRGDLKFHYIHSADSNSRIDPSTSNIIDLYLLTRNYDRQFRQWLIDAIPTKPKTPSADSLYKNYGSELDQIKSISDELIYHPVSYKILFGSKADTSLQATFKIVKNNEQVINDSELKVRVIDAINTFFSLENWEFGDTFYFSELSTYVMNFLAPDLATFVIVPNTATQGFGSLFEIKSESNEIFISGATVDNVEIIDAITASKLRASGEVVTSFGTDQSIVTSTNTSTSTTSTSYSSSSSSSSSSGSSGSSGGSGGSSGGGGGGYGY